MRLNTALIGTLLCVACAQMPVDIPAAPAAGATAVVFDIDGTLTPTQWRYWQPRDDASKAAQALAERGLSIFYVSARIRPLQSNIPRWLDSHGFPSGRVYVTETADDRRDHAQFKVRILRDLLAHGWQVTLAFGDSSSDFDAYAAVGIPANRVFALRREGATACQPGPWATCLSGWTEYLESMAE